jgi:hypothetical protein
MKSRAMPFAALLAAALVPAAQGTVRTSSGGQPQTTEPDVFVTIHVTITDARITLDRRSASRGDAARFVIRNVGTKLHGFRLGATKYGSGTQTGFSKTLKPREEKLILLFLDYRGRLPYYSYIKADLTKPGMKGIFRIL